MTADSGQDELREAVADLPFDGKGLDHTLAANMEPEYFDKLLDWIEHHTQEAVKAELQELANHYYHHEPDLDNAREALAIGLFNRLAELAAPQQSTSPDGEKKDGDEATN